MVETNVFVYQLAQFNYCGRDLNCDITDVYVSNISLQVWWLQQCVSQSGTQTEISSLMVWIASE